MATSTNSAGNPCCDPKLAGITMPCNIREVNLIESAENSIVFEVPIKSGEKRSPGISDPRLVPFLEKLTAAGVRSPEGRVLKPIGLNVATDGTNWIYEVRWT